MSREANKIFSTIDQGVSKEGLVTGLIDSVHEDGSVFVSLPGSTQRIRARTACQLSEFRDNPEQLVGREVLLSVAGFNYDKVIIVGLVNETLWSTVDLRTSADRDKKIDIRSDGKSVTITGDEEIVLTCGKSTISLKRDGTIIVRGRKVTTRAARENRIKGASVSIN